MKHGANKNNNQEKLCLLKKYQSVVTIYQLNCLT